MRDSGRLDDCFDGDEWQDISTAPKDAKVLAWYPTSGEVIIQLERANSSTATIRIINVLGQSIFNQTSSSKSLQMTTNLNQQASGIYWVQVEYEGIKLVRKLILIN